MINRMALIWKFPLIGLTFFFWFFAAKACGPYRCQSYFYTIDQDFPGLGNYGRQLDFSLQDFKRGRLGVLVPHLSLVKLWTAYRYLTNNPLSLSEQSALETVDAQVSPEGEEMQKLINTSDETSLNPPQEQSLSQDTEKVAWQKNVEKILTIKENYISSFSSLKITQGEQTKYIHFENCHEDAFRFANHHLDDLIKHGGQVSSEAIKTWVYNQRIVFNNCTPSNPSPVLPPPPAAGSLSSMLDDYRYQVASSYFYAADYGKSAALFHEQANTLNSLYRHVSAYLVLRSHYRNYLLKGAPGEIFLKAYDQYAPLLADSPYEKEALKLFQALTTRMDPVKELKKLSDRLLTSQNKKDRTEDLFNLVHLYRTQESFFHGTDFLDWIRVLRHPEAFSEAYEHWRKNKTLPWLIACITKLKALSHAPQDLLEAAQNTPLESPAYLTIQYHLAQHLSTIHPDHAATLIDRILELKTLSIAEKNRFSTLRAFLAKDENAFISHILQQPLMTTCLKKPDVPLDFRETFVPLLNSLPITVFSDLSRANHIPLWLKKRFLTVAFTRATLLKRQDEATQSLSELIPMIPSLAPLHKLLLEEQNPLRKHFIGLLIIAKFPVMTLVSYPAYWRIGLEGKEDVDRTSGLHDHWWSSSDLQQEYMRAPFLKERDHLKAQEEWSDLQHLLPQGMTDYFSTQTLKWHQNMPLDPLLPEMMHLCVRMSRHAHDEKIPKSSYDVFQRLHRHFKENSFAKKTPYHYYQP